MDKENKKYNISKESKSHSNNSSYDKYKEDRDSEKGKDLKLDKNERMTENLKKINILVEIATMIGTKIIDIIYMIKIKIIIVKKIIKKFMFKARFKW